MRIDTTYVDGKLAMTRVYARLEAVGIEAAGFPDPNGFVALRVGDEVTVYLSAPQAERAREQLDKALAVVADPAQMTLEPAA